MTEKTCIVYQTPTGFVIWNVIAAGGGRVVVEERNEVTRQVSIACITRAGELVWRNTNLPHSWWIHVGAVSANQVVLRLFENTKNPDAVTLLALKLETGEEVAVQPADYTITASQPFVYVQGEPEFETVRSFIRQKMKQEIFLGAEYLETEKLIIISYYTGQPATFTNLLACFDRQGLLNWCEEIGTNLKGMGVGTFFMTTDGLFFVKNKTELVTFRIV